MTRLWAHTLPLCPMLSKSSSHSHKSPGGGSTTKCSAWIQILLTIVSVQPSTCYPAQAFWEGEFCRIEVALGTGQCPLKRDFEEDCFKDKWNKKLSFERLYLYFRLVCNHALNLLAVECFGEDLEQGTMGYEDSFCSKCQDLEMIENEGNKTEFNLNLNLIFNTRKEKEKSIAELIDFHCSTDWVGPFFQLAFFLPTFKGETNSFNIRSTLANSR